MKKILFSSLTLLALLCMNILQAQVNIGGTPISFNYEKTGLLEPLTFEQMPQIDMAIIEIEDAQWEAERAAGVTKIGRRFGIEFEVDYDLHNSGIWTELPDGGKLWRLGVECRGALSINLIFDQCRLPKGATLYVFSVDKHDILGGFTNRNNQADNFFATDIVSSDKIIIEYYQPVNADSDGELRLATIVHGYRGLSLSKKLFDSKGFGQSGWCQRNTICPEGEEWQDQASSVFCFYSGGSEICSGAIVNNTANDGKPYALTANHCWNAAQNPGIWVFRFNWESPTCEPTTNAPYNTMSGAVLRMRTPTNTSSTDACLVELNQEIPQEYGVYYAGWSRSLVPSPSGMCISHPKLDIKKISPTYPLYTTTQYVQGWRADWSTPACTEGGSSGSPLFDSNRRIVGQLYGGPAYCGAPPSSLYDVYGRFDVSWNGTAASNRLRDWLDPLNLDPEVWDGRYGQIVDAELLAIIIPEDLYTSAATVEPKVTVKNSGDLPITAATVSYTIDGTGLVTKTWEGNLSVEETVDITFDAIKLNYGVHVFEATVVVADDGNNTNNKKSKTYEVVIEDGPYVNYEGYEVVGGDLLTYISTNTSIEVLLKNVGTTTTAGPITATISCDDPQLTINTATATHGALNVGETGIATFKITVANDIPDDKTFSVKVTVTDGSETWESIMQLKAYAPNFSLEKVLINGVEGDNLEKNAVVSLTAVVVNKGGAGAFNVKGDLEIDSEYIALACADEIIQIGKPLPAGETMNLTFTIITDPSMPYGYEANFNLLLNAHYGLSFNTPFAVTGTGSSDNYCTPESTNCSSYNDRFTSVILVKTSDQSELINHAPTCSNDGYTDYTNMVLTLIPGQQYTIKVKTGYQNHRARGWFDLNGNSIFDDNEKLIELACAVIGTEYAQTFTIPEDATPGTHRFRLRTRDGSTDPANGCEGYSWGQTLDYTIVIPEIYPRVQNVVAVLLENEIAVSWEAPENETLAGYNIYRNGERLNAALLTATNFTESNIIQGIYVYSVTAFYAGNKESYAEMSNIICNFDPPEFCESPRNLSATTEDYTVVLTWDEPENIDGILLNYHIFRDGEKIAETLPEIRIFTDEDLEIGIYVYQISAVYGHCESETTDEYPVEILSIGELQTASYNIYPNPTTGNVTFEGISLSRIEIYDVQGRKLNEYHASGKLQINVNHLNNGIYFVKMYSEDNQTVAKRLVIMR